MRAGRKSGQGRVRARVRCARGAARLLDPVRHRVLDGGLEEAEDGHGAAAPLAHFHGRQIDPV